MAQQLATFFNRTSAQTHHFRHSGPPPRDALERVKFELRSRGAVAYDLWLPETHYLPFILHRDEHIMGSVYGHYSCTQDGAAGRGAMIATDQRILFLDKKPLYMHCDELTFTIVGHVTYTRIGLFGYVTLHTRLGDFTLSTFNQKNAANFVDYIETRCLQYENEPEGKYDHVT